MRNNLFLGVAAAALLVPVAAMAQETTSTIRGSVTSGGAPIAGATVTIVNVPTGTTSTSVTDGNGGFIANGLRPGGPYTVSVSATGYSKTQITDINTTVAQAYDLPIDLGTEGSDNDVIVTASKIPNARTVSQGPATVLTAADIANVATINRDIRDLERRDPFARLDDSPTGGRAVSFAGQNARYNRFSVDGVPITDNFGLNTDGLPSRRSPIPLDAIGQFQAKVAPYDVREGNFQGGAINIVLKSGTNQFHGTGFYSYMDNGLVGKNTKPGPGIPTGSITVPSFKTQNFGAELSGPIIKDKLFFMVAGERLRGGRPIAEGPVDNNVGTAIPNLTQAQVDLVSQIAKDKYGYNTGGVLHDLGDKDDRLVARIDANLSDRQRLSLTYTYANDAINLTQNTFSSITTGSPGLGLASNAYIQGNRLHTGVVQWNSDWSDTFSTEARAYYKNYKRIQDPLLGRGFAQFRVCTNPTNSVVNAINSSVSPIGCERSSATEVGTDAVVSFGPDSSRQTNELRTTTWGGLLQARLTMNNHDVRLFGEMAAVSVFNAFLQNTSGNYYFDSIADFQAGRASSFGYGNAIPSLSPNDAAANFHYQSYTFGIMDQWRVSDTFNVSFGMRYDLFAQHDRPALSQAYVNRYQGGAYVNGQIVTVGPNSVNIGGIGLFQPRVGFDWKPAPRLSFRGGAGIFGGGAPDVYVSNSFSNTGVLTNSISINRTATGYSGATTDIPTGDAILNNVTGKSIPAGANTLLTNASVSSAAPINAIDRNFKTPSQWRGTLSGEYNANLGPLGDNWLLGVDFLYSKVRNQVFFTDIRSTPVTVAANALTPDGRIRYQNVIDGPTSTNTNTDILMTNTNKGRALIAIGRFDKSWDMGLSIYGSYTFQDIKDQSPATSSTAGSNYSNGAFVDANNVSYGTSNDQVRHMFKYGVTFDHAFFGDNKTTIALFGETRVGRPFSYTFQDFGSGRSAVFGTTGRSTATSTGGNRYLMYVPLVNDPLVSYSSTDYQNKLNAFIDSSGLGKFRGKVAPRNAFNSAWFTRLDLHVAQELPTGLFGSKVQVFADIENFTNFLNKKWGQLREYVFPYNAAVTQVQCLTTATVTGQGVVPVGTAAANNPQGLPAVLATNTSQQCAQYRYSPLGGTNDFVKPTDQVYVNQSLYTIRIGARFSF
ncbi:MAG: carboxypeptidase regulatory-like domain-containing protein [Candidatus Sphingomonas colombiensis]|nr:carboxypeptidase regulatory-like domain-containing protein [Sphingomonas sp.]WEK43586.1 MAG: carboxypeptidase regulatory-like domain-containing protein [Sphingomonas sp.]